MLTQGSRIKESGEYDDNRPEGDRLCGALPEGCPKGRQIAATVLAIFGPAARAVVTVFPLCALRF